MFNSERAMILKRLEKYNKDAIDYGVSTDDDEWRVIKFEDDEIQIEITSMTTNDNYPVPTLTMRPSAGPYPVSIILNEEDGPMELCEDGIVDSSCRTLKKCMDVVADWLIANAM